MEGFTSMIRREPVGVIAQVAPWNYPMMMAVWSSRRRSRPVTPLCWKPSDTTPVSTARIAQMIAEAEILPRSVQRHHW